MRGRDRSCRPSKVWGGYDFGTDGRFDLGSAQAVEAPTWKRRARGWQASLTGRAAVRQNRANQAKLRRCKAKYEGMAKQRQNEPRLASLPSVKRPIFAG